MQNPERVPLCVQGSQIGLSDVLTFDLSLSKPNDPHTSEWGFKRERTPEGAWIVPDEPFLDKWSEVDEYKAPSVNLPRRLARVKQAAQVCGDRYRLARFGLSGYSVYRALRGKRWSSEDFLRDPERFQELMELIFEFEVNMFDGLARAGFHGVEFTDGWGSRKTSRFSLQLWRILLREGYAKVIKRAKDVGLQIWFSPSDDCVEFINDLTQIGVDVIKIESPSSLDVASLGRYHRGRVSFAVRIDELYDPNDDEGSRAMIRETQDCLGVLTGGFIGTVAANCPPEKIRVLFDIVKEFKGLN